MKSFKRFIAAVLAASMLLMIAGCGGDAKDPGNGENNSGNTYVMKVSTTSNEYTFVGKGHQRLKELIEERSDGRISVELYFNGQLASNAQSLEFVRDGSLQYGMTATAAECGKIYNDGRWSYLEVPFLFDGSEESLYKTLDGESFKLLKENVEENWPVIIPGAYMLGWFDIANTVRPIEKMEDFKGLKIRSNDTPIWIDNIKLLGANPTPMSWGEIYTGLQQKTIDGVCVARNLISQYKFDDYAKNVIAIGMAPTVHVSYLNGDWYNSLPEDLQAVVMDSIEETLAEMRVDASKDDKEAFEIWESKDMQVTIPDAGFMQQIKDLAAPVAEARWGEIGKEFRDIVESDLAK